MNIDLPEMAVDLAINILNIIILFVIVKLLVYKPVKKFLDARTQRVADSLKAGEEAEKAAKALNADKDSVIDQGKRQAEEIIESAKREAERNARAITEKAQKDASDFENKARAEIETERKAMLESARDDIARLAVDISERILKREINDGDNMRIVDEFFSDGGGKEQ